MRVEPIERQGQTPILVTGAPRSGTTWVGRMLALCPALNYVHEPFNPAAEAGNRGCNLRLKDYFTYITEDNESRYYRPVKRILEGRYDLGHALLGARSLSGVVASLREWRRFVAHRRAGGATLIKDPIALLSAGWLARRFDIRCVVMIRHPAAFVASMKRLDWASHPEKWALSQELLMRDYLRPFAADIEELQTGEHDLIERASLAWKLHNFVVLQYKMQYKDWIFLRHEDISNDPAASFQKLYEKLGLVFSESVRRAIDEHSNASNPERATENERTIRLNSRANISAWKDRLSAEEVQRIKAYVEDVAREFYSDSEWN